MAIAADRVVTACVVLRNKLKKNHPQGMLLISDGKCKHGTITYGLKQDLEALDALAVAIVFGLMPSVAALRRAEKALSREGITIEPDQLSSRRTPPDLSSGE